MSESDETGNMIPVEMACGDPDKCTDSDAGI